MEFLKNNLNVLTHVLLLGKIQQNCEEKNTIAFFGLEEKMHRGFIIILIMQLGFFIHGCATLKHIDGSSNEELKKFKTSK